MTAYISRKKVSYQTLEDILFKYHKKYIRPRTMSAETILILAIISPKPGKMDRVSSPTVPTAFKQRKSTDAKVHSNQVLELAEPLAKGIKNTEPNCIEIRDFREINPESGADELYTVERCVWPNDLSFRDTILTRRMPCFADSMTEMLWTSTRRIRS
jgi:hypothetical protein